MGLSNNYKTSLNDILFSVRLLSLFFAFMAFLERYYKTLNSEDYNSSNIIYTVLIMFGVITFIYVSFTNVYPKGSKLTGSRMKWVEFGLMFLIIFAAVFVTGFYASGFKILFVLLVVSYTLDFGLKPGVIIASVLSVGMLIVDLAMAPTVDGVNIHFQEDLILCGVMSITAWALGYYSQTETKYIEDLKELANIDGLTLLYNHRAFHETISGLFEKAKRDNTRLAMIYIDIDYFKDYNDIYGHLYGDEALRSVADIFARTLGDRKYIFRYGGDEFAVILPDYNIAQATKMAETLRLEINKYPFYGEEMLPGKALTVSMGVAAMQEKYRSYSELISEADGALYKAKLFSKNRVETYTSILDKISGTSDNSKIADAITSIRTMIAIINSRDYYTYGHTERVVSYADCMAKRLNLPQHERELLVYSAYVHDVGKINISNDILLKVGQLSSDEWGELKKHSLYSAEIVEKTPGLEGVSDIILEHHERYDGTGYPKGTAGENINHLSRMLSVVDSFDAMVSVRPYKGRLSLPEAVEELRRNAGTQFDPVYVEEFIQELEQICALSTVTE